MSAKRRGVLSGQRGSVFVGTCGAKSNTILEWARDSNTISD